MSENISEDHEYADIVDPIEGLESSPNPLRPSSALCICAISSRLTPSAASRLTVEALGLFFDYSKNRITGETLKLLIDLAAESGLAIAHRRHVSRRQDQRH